MASGQARKLHEATGKRVRILDRYNRMRWHPLWEGLPYIVRPGEVVTGIPGEHASVVSGPGARAYIAGKTDLRWTWRDCPPARGEICLTRAELDFGERYAGRVIVEPNVKPGASPNKDWGLQRWRRLVDVLHARGVRVTQLGGQHRFLGGEMIDTPTFRHACAVLARAKAAVLTEGALHHAAAALGVPAIVIFGGYISPAQTGYDGHVNLFTGGKPCGARVPCQHCATAMAAITPEDVAARLVTMLQPEGVAA